MILVDSNILIDIFTDDPKWAEWSMEALLNAAKASPLGINPLIYSEVSVAFTNVKSLDQAIETLGLARWDLPYEAGFHAGKAFLEYRRAGGEKRSPLPDFYIGAHAQVDGLCLVTRDAKRYTSYFPDVRLVSP